MTASNAPYPQSARPELSAGGGDRRALREFERILLAEADPELRGYLAELLSSHWRIETAEDGAKALVQSRAQPPSLIIADVAMPHLDGFDLLQALRSDDRTKTIPVILISTRADAQSNVEGLNAGADDYLVKPFGARELVARVAARLEIARVRREAERRVTGVLESMSDGVQVFDSEWRLTYLNPAARLLIEDVGGDPDAMIGRMLWEDLFRESRNEASARHFRRAMQERVRIQYEDYYEPFQRWHECRLYPLPDGGVANYFRDVTERKRAEAASREWTERMQLAAEAAQLFFWDIDLASGAIQYSENVAQIFGYQTLPREYYDVEDAIGLVHEEDRARVLEVARRTVSEGRAFTLEHRIKAACGTYFWFESRGVVSRDAQGMPTRLLGIAENICARKRTEEELGAAEQRLRLALDTAKIYSWDVDMQTGKHTRSPKHAEVLGFELSDGPVEAFLFVHPDDRESIKEAYRRAVEGAGKIDIELRMFDPPSGRSVWTRAHGLLVRAADGTPLRMVGITQNIDVHKHNEQALRESEERFRAMADDAPIFIWVSDAQGRHEFVNRAYLDFYAIERAQAAAFDWTAILHPEDRERYVAEFHTALHQARPFHCRARVRRHDGAWRWIESRGNARVDAAGRVTGYIGCSPDITEFLQSQEVLKEADRRKDEFLATLSHELRNPLAPLRHGLQILKLARGDAEAREQARAMMERQLGQMVALVDDLLDLSRISRGQITIHKQRIELRSVVASALEACEPAIRQGGHNLTVSLPPEPIYVHADKVRLAQVLSNLLSNAAKYTESGGRIAFTVHGEGAEVVIRVKDTGIGIPAHMLSKVFEMFTQVDSTGARAQGGLGIGLTIVKQLIGMHGGTVEARSGGRGMGSEFLVRLPVALSVVGEPQAAAPYPAAHRARHRILVVDDNKDAAFSLALMLKLMGNDTQTAHGGMEALELGEVFRPDVVLMDIGMPDLSGYSTAQLMREQPWGQHLLLIAVTGWGQEVDRRASEQAGFDRHLVKPVEPDELEKLLGALQSAAS